MDRNLKYVVNDMLITIPNTEKKFKSELQDELESIRFSAPELIGMWWNKVYSTLMSYIPEKPIEEWQFEILSIFSTKSVDELKKLLK